jgi:hypothetical protein
VLLIHTLRPRKPVILSGVVLVDDSDPRNQAPIAGAEITATGRLGQASGRSDASGLFRLTMPAKMGRETLGVTVRHAGYMPLGLTATGDSELLVVRMRSSAPLTTAVEAKSETAIANVRIRYSGKSTTTTNIGSIAETFEVSNTGNVACGGVPPCSPDNRWKASVGSYSVDAGEGNELRSIRLSCIAGPCAFTQVNARNLSQNGRTLRVSVLNWSDTTMFLLEAEVSQTRISDVVRQSYPAIFGSTMSFTLPAESEGPSIEADLNGNDIVFPLGPDLIVSWANCSMAASSEQGNLYRCELKAGYRFK